MLFDQSIEPISADEARGLLVGEKGTLPKVFLLAASVTLEHGGCLQLLAVVKPEGSQTPIYSGQAVVPVR